MIPTLFSGLLIGVETIQTLAIKALSTWITGSMILAGNLFFDTTANTTPKAYVNTTQVASMSETGVTLLQGGLARYATAYATCTSTGGITNYSTCYLESPLATTGSLLSISLECGNVPKALAGDVSFKLTRLSATGTAITNLNNITAGTGALQTNVFTTEQAWNPAEAITFSTLTDPSGAAVDCRLYADYHDKYGT